MKRQAVEQTASRGPSAGRSPLDPPARGRARRASAICLAALIVLCIASAPVRLVGDDASAQVIPSPTPVTTSPSSTDVQIRDLNQRVDDLQTTVNVLLVVIGVFLTLLTGGGLFGFVTSLRAERRAEQRAIEIQGLAIRGETAAQQRAEDSYETSRDSSQKTVNLVNDTLELSRAATERAATTLRQHAEADLADLDSQALTLLDPVLLGDNFKEVVERPSVRAGVLELASEVTSIEGYIRSQELDLTALCYFVKGMGRHLAQQSGAAIKYLREAARHAAPAGADLEVFAQFWAGYELNNVNKPAEAAVTFRRAAQAVASGSGRYFELSRIAIESEFFELAGLTHSAEDQLGRVQSLDDELFRLQEATRAQMVGLDEATASIANTRGNIWLWAALISESIGDSQSRDESLHKAIDEYGDAEATSGSLWSRFGALEAEFRLTQRVDRDGYRGIENETIMRLTNRREPRSMALFGETRFIAICRCAESSQEVVSAFKDARDKLEVVDDGLTLYSQVRKHNVTWPAFAAELDELQRDALSNLPRTPA